MTQEELKKIMSGINNMPESEIQYISKDIKKAAIEFYIYQRCIENNNMAAWNKLKMLKKL